MVAELTGEGRAEGGIFLRGLIVGRTRKQTEGGFRYTYTVDTGYGVIRASMWGEHDFMPVGSQVDAEVQIKPYITNRGAPMYQLVFPSKVTNNGEETF